MNIEKEHLVCIIYKESKITSYLYVLHIIDISGLWVFLAIHELYTINTDNHVLF